MRPDGAPGGSLAGAAVLVTGGTGSFGRAFTGWLLAQAGVRRVAVLSRDELKQWEMQQLWPGEPRLRFFLGDVRDPARLRRAFDGIDVVVHAAALKQIPAIEYNPFEAVRTNIQGAENVIAAAIDAGVGRVVALSTDKASSPINLYGATKLVADKLFVSGNAYAGGKATRLAVVRYGNIVGSRGGVIQHFRALAATGRLPITDPRMTRFWITLEQAVGWVATGLDRMRGGEIFVPKLPSMRITDLAEAIAPGAGHELIGIRPGEKLHEEMISAESGRHTLEFEDHYVIQPDLDWWQGDGMGGRPVPEGFRYASDSNSCWLTVEQLRKMVDAL
jgi:UDP-N-acetylglucosamine 4,6-dehydratase